MTRYMAKLIVRLATNLAKWENKAGYNKFKIIGHDVQAKKDALGQLIYKHLKIKPKGGEHLSPKWMATSKEYKAGQYYENPERIALKRAFKILNKPKKINTPDLPSKKDFAFLQKEIREEQLKPGGKMYRGPLIELMEKAIRGY